MGKGQAGQQGLDFSVHDTVDSPSNLATLNGTRQSVLIRGGGLISGVQIRGSSLHSFVSSFTARFPLPHHPLINPIASSRNVPEGGWSRGEVRAMYSFLVKCSQYNIVLYCMVTEVESDGFTTLLHGESWLREGGGRGLFRGNE